MTASVEVSKPLAAVAMDWRYVDMSSDINGAKSAADRRRHITRNRSATVSVSLPQRCRMIMMRTPGEK